MTITKVPLQFAKAERNTLTQAELEAIREVYNFPPTVEAVLPGPGDSILDAPEGFIGVYYYHFYSGMRLPIPRPILKFCRVAGVPLAQFHPNAFKAMLTIHHLLADVGQTEDFRAVQILHLYRLCVANSSWISFARFDPKPGPVYLRESVQGWKHQFFFLRGEGVLPAKADGTLCVPPTNWVTLAETQTNRQPLPEDRFGAHLTTMLQLPREERSLVVILKKRFPEWGRWAEGDWYNAALKLVERRNPDLGKLVAFNEMKVAAGKRPLVPEGAAEVAPAPPRKKTKTLKAAAPRVTLVDTEDELDEVPLRARLPSAVTVAIPPPVSVAIPPPVVTDAQPITIVQAAEAPIDVGHASTAVHMELGLTSDTDTPSDSSSSSTSSAGSRVSSSSQADTFVDVVGLSAEEQQPIDRQDAGVPRTPDHHSPVNATDEAESRELGCLLDARPGDPHHVCHLATVPASLHRFEFQPSEAIRQAAIGQQLGMSHVPANTAYDGPALGNIGFQKIGEGVHFLEKCIAEYAADARAEIELAKEELGAAQQKINALESASLEQESAQRALANENGRLHEELRQKDGLLASQSLEMGSLRADADALRAQVEKLQEEKLMYKRLSLINAPSGFDTFREVGRGKYPDMDWDQFTFDASIYASIAEARATSQEMLSLPPTPPVSP